MFLHAVAPQIIAAPKQQTLHLGSHQNVLTCLVTGGIRTVDWRKDNKTINDTTRYKILASGSLQLTANVSESDSGVYTCRASNKAGTVLKEVEVKVQESVSGDLAI